MHPHKKEGVAGHNAKLKRMTRHYGDADPAMKRNAPVDMAKTEGPEEAPEFGADSAAPNARADRPARRSAAANPLSTYKHGGKVKHGSKHRARGGRAGKGHTHVNVTVMPQSGQQPGALPPPVVPVGGPAVPPAMQSPTPPMPLMGGPGGPNPMAMAPGGLPPGALPPRAKGGRVVGRDSPAKLKGNQAHLDDGSESGPGRLEKAAARKRNAKYERPQAV